jgi:molybdopterin/thiamine biosynthesis adenylyltransferase
VKVNFSSEQIERYSRHILLQDIGVEGQRKISKGKVLVIGAGGLGSPILFYLAAAGVETLGIIDGEVVELSNLHRQIIHFTSDIGKRKIQSAKEKIIQINPNVNVVTYDDFFNVNNAFNLIKDYDFIVDGTDNFSTKFLINDACILASKPFSHGGVLRFDGQTFTHITGTMCYRCVFCNPPSVNIPTCLQTGVLGSVAGILGAIQATEVLKFFTGTEELLTNCLLTFNVKSMNFRKININKNRECPICGNYPVITNLTEAKCI